MDRRIDFSPLVYLGRTLLQDYNEPRQRGTEEEERARKLNQEEVARPGRCSSGSTAKYDSAAALALADLASSALAPSINGSGNAPIMTMPDTTDSVAADLPSHQRAILNAIAVGESSGLYDVRYMPKGGASFAQFGVHSGIIEPGPHRPFSAARRAAAFEPVQPGRARQARPGPHGVLGLGACRVRRSRVSGW
jgi:hypothetical protein